MVHKVILQMYKATLKDQIFVGQIRKCFKNPDMDSYFSICYRSDCKKKLKIE